MSHQVRKRFGQHFLHDPQVIQRIINAINPKPDQHLVEIGPGQGAITLPLLDIMGRLDVVELDRDLIPILQKACTGKGELHVHQADALKFDFCQLIATPDEKLRLVGNLPYNISTPLLFHLVTQRHCIADMYFMLQKEVVERIVASPGGGDYGRLSVMLQYYCQVTELFSVGPGAFKPPPKVSSAIIYLVPHAQPPVQVDNDQALAWIVNRSFSMRRKTLRKSLKGYVDSETMKDLDIDPMLRPECLSLAQFALLANALPAPVPDT